MSVLLRWSLLSCLILMALAACSTPAPRPAPSASATSSPTTSATDSPFCQDMQTLQVGVLVWRDDVLQAARGVKQLDVDGLRQRAANIAYVGQSVLKNAPADISGQIHGVLDAIATSADRMARPGATVRDAYDPLFNDAIGPAFDAVDNYDCSTTG